MKKTKTKTKTIRLLRSKQTLPLVSIFAFAIIAATLVVMSNAATDVNNPIGTASYCRLENGKTVIYGWAHDGNASSSQAPKVRVVAGSTIQEVWTDQPSGRDASIESQLKKRGIATKPQYGFKAEFPGMYKGSAPAISGLVYNQGKGSANTVPLAIYTGDGSAGAGGNYYFASNKIPNACLADKPVVPIYQNPTPSPTPTPAGPSTASPSGPTKSTPQTPKSPSRNATPPAPATEQTTDQAAADTDAPKPILYDLVVTLTLEETPLPDIEISLVDSDTKATTDFEGVATLAGLTTKNNILRFNYDNKTYEKEFDLTDEEVLSATVTQSIDVSQLTEIAQEQNEDAQTTPEKKSSKAGLIITLTLLTLTVTGVVAFIIIKRRSAETLTDDMSLYVPPVAPPTPSHSVPPSQSPTRETPPNAQLPTSGHPKLSNTAGISLKDLVIQSIREENARRNKNS